MKDRIKKFYKDHENTIIFGGVVVAGLTGTFAASYTTTRRGLDQLRVERVGYDKENEMISIVYKNGSEDRYFPTPV